jgi:hypothetical protein
MAFIISRSENGFDRKSTSYLTGRKNPIGKSVGGKFHFVKTSKNESATFRTPETAKKVLKSVLRMEDKTNREYFMEEI